jgi:hypothetical protein
VSANGWAVTVTPTGDVTTYDVKPMGGGRDPDTGETDPEPYDIVTTTPGAPFHAVFEFATEGWKLVSLTYDRPRYPGGQIMSDDSSQLVNSKGWLITSSDGNLMYPNQNVPLATPTGLQNVLGHGLSDQWGNILANNGAVVAYDSGMSAMGLSAPPGSSSAFGNAGMVTWDSGYLYVCIAANSWKRIALSSF